MTITVPRQAGRTLFSLARLVCVCGLVPGMSGCSSGVQVQTLATGRSDVSAHALGGADIDALRREAQRLCPLGGEILRQAGQPPPAQVGGSRWRQVLGATVQWVAPPPPPGQLVVMCRESPERLQWQAAMVLTPAPAASAVSVGPIAPPPAVGAALAGGMATAAITPNVLTPQPAPQAAPVPVFRAAPALASATGLGPVPDTQAEAAPKVLDALPVRTPASPPAPVPAPVSGSRAIAPVAPVAPVPAGAALPIGPVTVEW